MTCLEPELVVTFGKVALLFGFARESFFELTSYRLYRRLLSLGLLQAETTCRLEDYFSHYFHYI
jgi:hypothetical protein